MVVKVKGLKIKITYARSIWDAFSYGNMVQLKKNIEIDMERAGITGNIKIEWLTGSGKKIVV